MRKLKKLKDFNFSYVIGRFSKKIGSKFQHFPIDNWEKDLDFAKKFNFDGTEWIISDFSNPIFNESFRKIIKKKLKKKRMKIFSISLDLIMNNPLHKIHENDVTWLINMLNKVIKYFSIKRVTIPIEERSRFNNFDEKKIALKNLKKFYLEINKVSNLCVETDISPHSLKSFLNLKSFEDLGILLDVGNTKAHGYSVKDYIELHPNRIYGIHIKYRDKFYGKSSIIKKNFNELKILMQNINKLKNCKDITFQTFFSDKNFLNDMKLSIKNYNQNV